VWGLDATLKDTPRLLQLCEEARKEQEQEEEAEQQAGSAEASLASAEAATLRTPLAALLAAQQQGECGRAALLCWALLFHALLCGGEGGSGVPGVSEARRDALRAWLHASPLLPPLLSQLAAAAPAPPAKAARPGAAAAAAEAECHDAWAAALEPRGALRAAPRLAHAHLCTLQLGCALAALPGACRSWWSGLRDNRLAATLEASVAAMLSPALVQRELRLLSAAGAAGGLSVRVSGRDVVACYAVDEAKVEVTLRFAGAYPLRAPTAECERRVGVSEARLRKWLLSISACLRTGGGVAAALRLWGDSCAREFEGVEPCPICYCVVSPGHALPRLGCKQCRNKFHSACLYNWFTSSNKSSCPLCMTAWGTTV
jgi:hypothetical protein